MNPLRQLFLSTSLRERVLLVAFLFVMLLIWALYLMGNLRATNQALNFSAQTLERQEIQLSRADEVQARLGEILANWDSSRTYSGTQLVGRIDEIARELFPRYDLSSATSQESEIFASHVVRLRIDNGNISELVAFNQRIQEENPYIVLSQFQIASRQRDPRQLDASFEITSIELKPGIGR